MEVSVVQGYLGRYTVFAKASGHYIKVIDKEPIVGYS